MVNTQAERVFGYERKELLGEIDRDAGAGRFRQGHPAMRGSFFGTPVSRPMGVGRDLFGLKKDGSEFPIEIGLNPIETDEGPWCSRPSSTSRIANTESRAFMRR